MSKRIITLTRREDWIYYSDADFRSPYGGRTVEEALADAKSRGIYKPERGDLINDLTTNLIAVVSNRDQKIISSYPDIAEARRKALTLVRDFKLLGKLEEAENIYILAAYELTEQEKTEIEKEPKMAGIIALGAMPQERPLFYYMAAPLNPLDLDIDVIPEGEYCYTWVDDPNHPTEEDLKDETRIFITGFKPVHCPYFEHIEIVGVKAPWCRFMQCSGMLETFKEGEWERLLEHFGTREKVYEKLPIDNRLSDAMKCCGLN